MLKHILAIALCLTSFSSLSEELTEEKKHVIDEMLEITGAFKIAEMMGTAIGNQMIDALARQQDAALEPKVVEVIKDELAKIMHDEFISSGFINEMSYNIYHKYFSTTELREIVAFYRSPAGGKLAMLNPQIMQEGVIAGQQRGASLGPVIEQRLRERFKREGIQ